VANNTLSVDWRNGSLREQARYMIYTICIINENLLYKM